MNKTLEKTVERTTGRTIAQIRKMTLGEQRRLIEKKYGGHSMQFRKCYPIIGRGNIMRDHTKSLAEIEALVDKALI